MVHDDEKNVDVMHSYEMNCSGRSWEEKSQCTVHRAAEVSGSCAAGVRVCGAGVRLDISN